ncbi:MAG: type II toxin-antitoxin system prevent-host-death family antitoxin [Chloroflexi bacterium]|nr:type II toxin-antitoxin system prevent-host-death family antitoxin [Chloroflexota bacterium]
MPGNTYSTYEAKARFSEVLRQVRTGTTVTVTYRGEPVAEIRPIEPQPMTIEERLDELERRGVLIRKKGPRKPFRPLADRPGALERFLAERDE